MHFADMAGIMDTLRGIAQKELQTIALSAKEKEFLRQIIYELHDGCGPTYRGWYSRLYYTGEMGFMKEDRVVADVHTVRPMTMAQWLDGCFMPVQGPRTWQWWWQRSLTAGRWPSSALS